MGGLIVYNGCVVVPVTVNGTLGVQSTVRLRQGGPMQGIQVCAAEMAVRYAALCASRKVHT